ncbi:hypothetical protein PIB30_071233 [Stylosanthes scabra]|uniref:Uncharacterized protein n=1 Tax=Stylosanthes scabra TaxID=79078 RepID=A0ABU6SPE9_9FABA|nr:hypothetical protein [Stylosanthes scabra]
MAEGTQSGEDELPVFDGIGSGYGWSILAQQFWNARGVSEAQRFLEVSSAFTGRTSIWFHLWSLRNPNADWDTFDLAFPHQFQPDMRPILPEICWKEPEQGIVAAESEEKKEVEEEVDSDSTNNEIDAEGAKLEENQDLNLGQLDSPAEENALIDAEVNTVPKEEGGDTVNEGGD